jgi:hypothetical protein
MGFARLDPGLWEMANCCLLVRVSIDSLSADAREWSERIDNVRKNVKKADDDLKNLMITFLKVEFFLNALTSSIDCSLFSS